MTLGSPLSLKTPDARRRFFIFATGYVLVWLACWYSAKLVDVSGGASLWFLPAGIRFSAFMILGWVALPIELVAVLIANASQFMMSGSRFHGLLTAQSFWFLYDWVALPCIYAVVILPVRGQLRARLDLTLPLHSFIFIGLGLCAAALGAAGGTLHLVGASIIEPAQGAQALLDWFVGDFLGVLALSPLLLVRVWPGLHSYLEHGKWRRSRKHVPASKSLLRGHQDLQTVLVCLVGLVMAFGTPVLLNIHPNLPSTALLLLLPLAGLAMFYGLRSAVLSAALLEAGLMLMMIVFEQREQIRQYQLVMISVALVGLWLGGAVGARNRLMVRYIDFARVSNDLLWETDQEGRLVSAQGRLASKFNMSIGHAWREMLNTGAQPHLQALEHAIRQQRPLQHLEIKVTNQRNDERWIELNAVPVHNETGQWVGYRGTATDITRAHRAKILMRDYNKELLTKVSQRTAELRHANEELAFKKRHLQVLLAAAPVGVLEFDENSRCRYLNANASTLTSRSAEQALGRHLLDFVHPDDRDRTELAWTKSQASREVQWLDFRLSRSNLWCSACWINVCEPGLLTESGAILALTDATLRHQQDEQLWTLAHHDALTGLPNRNLFWDRCAQALSLSKRHETNAAILWIDLDGFKAVNDSLGHAAGDELLKEVAQRLKNRVRDSDTVARMGGDEFSVIMPNMVETQVLASVAAGLLKGLNEPYMLSQGEVQISGSIGIAVYPEHAQSVETLTKYADMAMYNAKHAGKNQIQIWSDACFSESAWGNSGYSTF